MSLYQQSVGARRRALKKQLSENRDQAPPATGRLATSLHHLPVFKAMTCFKVAVRGQIYRGLVLRKCCQYVQPDQSYCSHQYASPYWNPELQGAVWLCSRHAPPFGLDRRGRPRVKLDVSSLSPRQHGRYLTLQLRAKALRREMYQTWGASLGPP